MSILVLVLIPYGLVWDITKVPYRLRVKTERGWMSRHTDMLRCPHCVPTFQRKPLDSSLIQLRQSACRSLHVGEVRGHSGFLPQAASSSLYKGARVAGPETAPPTSLIPQLTTECRGTRDLGEARLATRCRRCALRTSVCCESSAAVCCPCILYSQTALDVAGV